MNNDRRAYTVAVLSAMLLACGGSEHEVPLTARERADAAESNARVLIQVAACSSDQQCSFVTFEDAFPSCSQGRHEPYLLTSKTATAAVKAAALQAALAREARLAPGNEWNFGCAAYVEPLPIPQCQQGRCASRPGFEFTVAAPQ